MYTKEIMKLINIITNLQNKNNQFIVPKYIELASLYEKAGLYEKAIEIYKKIIDFVVCTTNHADYYWIYNKLAFLYYNLGMYEEAMRFRYDAFNFENMKGNLKQNETNYSIMNYSITQGNSLPCNYVNGEILPVKIYIEDSKKERQKVDNLYKAIVEFIELFNYEKKYESPEIKGSIMKNFIFGVKNIFNIKNHANFLKDYFVENHVGIPKANANKINAEAEKIRAEAQKIKAEAYEKLIKTMKECGPHTTVKIGDDIKLTIDSNGNEKIDIKGIENENLDKKLQTHLNETNINNTNTT